MLEAPFKEDPLIAVTGSSRDLWRRRSYFIVFFCAMLRRDVLDELGLLDMTFNPGCGEDADFCLRAQSNGYKVRQVPHEHDRWVTTFPIWHVGHHTIVNLPWWGGVATKNSEILEERHPRDEEDRKAQKSFSEGLQNYHLWYDKT